MQTITISGNIGREPELRTTQSGDKALSFSVGVKQGYGDNVATNWFRCSVWGKRGETLNRYLRKGTKVVVQGELTIGDYQGKPQYEIRANEVEFMSAGEKATEPARGRVSDSEDWNRQTDDLGDEVPF